KRQRHKKDKVELISGGIEYTCAPREKPNSNLEKSLLRKKNGGASNFSSTPHRHLMQGKAQVKLSNRAIRLCDDPVREKIFIGD
ncbi:MAG TPA: hypothetical protein VFY40_23695, partial [Blastocatellia bacterium]|nr:hypothetical protein [Blastocatellia bacterium]